MIQSIIQQDIQGIKKQPYKNNPPEYEQILTFFDRMSTGDRIKRYRKFLGYTQEQLADSVHVSPSMLSKYENNHVCIMNAEILKEIAAVFQIPAICLLDSTWWEIKKEPHKALF